MLSPLLLHASCGPNSIYTHRITSLFLRLMILQSCLWLIMPWIFITGSGFQNCCCLECFQSEPFSPVLQFATVPVTAAVQQQMIWKCNWFVSALVTPFSLAPLGTQECIRLCRCDSTGSLLQPRCVSGFGLSLRGLCLLNAGSGTSRRGSGAEDPACTLCRCWKVWLLFNLVLVWSCGLNAC